MNVTESRFKNRQLHIEDYLQMVSAEQKEYAEVFDYSKITEKSSVITDYWTNNLLELILRKDNLNKAYKQVKRNKGKGGIDGMQVDELLPFTVPNVPTGIKMGVSICPWSVVINPARAFDLGSVYCKSKVIFISFLLFFDW